MSPRWILPLTLLSIAAATLVAVRAGHVPDRWLPWATLAIADRPGPFDGQKLARLDGDACIAVLRAADIAFTRVDDRDVRDGCGWTDAVQLTALQAALDRPTTLSCRAAVSLALWDRHVLQREAILQFDRRVTRIEHYGSYACRDIAGGRTGRRSRHAQADALDVAAIALEGGERIALLRDWRGEDPARRAFLRRIHAGACRWFDGVLGPDYNAAHADHLHLERGGWSTCR